jgi:hypothetical protein
MPTPSAVPVRLEFESSLPVSTDVLWAWITSVDGILAEMWPLVRMTVPRSVKSLTDVNVRFGEPLFRSWVLLFGIVPVDRSDLTLVEMQPGQRFLEQSPMLGMKLWRHERVIAPSGSGSKIIDRLEFQPRFGVFFMRWFVKTLFAHRHRVLRRALK